MFHKDLNYSVNILDGVNGSILREYDSERGRTTRSIEAVTGMVLCTQITLHKNFEWYDADGLYVAIRYGSRNYQIELWIPKSLTSQLDGEDDWSLKIPGKNVLGDDWRFQIPERNILGAATNKTSGCQFRFTDLEVSDLYSKPPESHISYVFGHAKSITEQERLIAVDR